MEKGPAEKAEIAAENVNNIATYMHFHFQRCVSFVQIIIPLVLCTALSVYSQETSDLNRTFKITLHTPPSDDRPVYLSSSINNWSENDENFRFNRVSEHSYELSITLPIGQPDFIEFKFTKGSWGDVALDRFGNELAAVKLPLSDTFLEIFVPAWKKNGVAYKPDLMPVIKIIDEHFEIPQLIKTRRIAAILPHDYHQTDKHYPVLYLQDGQNLFDDHAPFGSWELPKKLAFMSEHGFGDIIVVAIDHAEAERVAEFTPTRKTKLGVGDGKNYAAFLAETLKPYIDENFRTLPERENTGIGGSSMGGLISIYAAMKYPSVYSKLMIFSPSLWVSPALSAEFIRDTPEFYGKIYLYGGAKEGSNMVEHLRTFEELVLENPHNRNLPVHVSIREDGEHNEAAWGYEFPRAAKWLYFTPNQ